LKFQTKPRWNPKRNVAFSFTWRAANLFDFLFLFFSLRREWKNCIVQVLSAENYTFVRTRLKFRTKPRWNPKRNVGFSFTWMAANLYVFFFYYFFHSVENEKIVSFKFFRPKITRSFVLGWNFKRNLVETPNEMPHFHVLEGPQIWMTFYFYFFHSLDMDIIVSFKFFRPKIIHSYIHVWNFKRNPLKPQKKCRIFIYLKCRKFVCLIILIFFIA
jgi:hypothetical protein